MYFGNLLISVYLYDDIGGMIWLVVRVIYFVKIEYCVK